MSAPFRWPSLPLALLSLALALPAAAAEDAQQLARTYLQHEHQEVRAHLQQVRGAAGSAAALEAVALLRQHALVHARWEEAALFPLVDRLASRADHPFVATMRAEHARLALGMEELAREATAPQPDRDALRARVDALASLLEVHFGKEERVLLPVVRRYLTPELLTARSTP